MTIKKTHPIVIGSTTAITSLAKGYNQPMNTMRLPAGAPLVNTPRRATVDLLRQAQQKINKGQDRKSVLSQLVTSTRRAPAAVAAPPAAAAAPGSGFGGAGYSGRDAAQLGHAVNSGTSTPAPAPPAAPAPAAPALATPGVPPLPKP